MLDRRQGQVMINRKPRTSTAIDRKKVIDQTRNAALAKSSETAMKKTAQPSKVTVNSSQTRQMVAAQSQVRPSAKELKNTAIEKALASTMKASAKEAEKKPRMHFGFKRVLLALVCSAAAVFAIVYFVNLNAPNISLKVAAMQTGIEASYPAYIPRDYSLSNIASESGKITLNFKNASTEDSFSLIEEKSSWDTHALLNSFVRQEYGNSYTVVKEQGLTIYISGSSAAWVNGGIVYKIDAPADSLTKKQIKSIAVSL